jgi:hypothetical protein
MRARTLTQTRKPCAASAPATFVAASATQNWAGRPSRSFTLKMTSSDVTPASLVDRCQAACAKRAAARASQRPAAGCAAFSVSVALGRLASDASAPRWCHLWAPAVPTALCAPGDTTRLCARASLGSYRLRYGDAA